MGKKNSSKTNSHENLFIQLSNLYAQVSSWEEVIEQLLKLTLSHLEADCGWFALFNDKKDGFSVENLYGIPPEIIEDLSSVLSLGSMKGGSIFINNIDKIFSGEKKGFPSALICYPFVSNDRFLGSIFLCRKNSKNFSDSDRAKLESLCFYSEKIIENALMFKEIQQSRKSMGELIEKIHLLEKIQHHLSKFVPNSVMKLIEDQPDNPQFAKHKQHVTVLFLDIEGYTNINLKLDPDKVNFLIETYFSSFLDDIYSNQGDINETAGDGLMIIYLDKSPKINAKRAIDTAIAIQEKVFFIEKNLKKPRIPFNINIGIHSGEALVGSVKFSGSSGDRWTFTASGITTTISSRITSYATKGKILISDDTAKLIHPQYNPKKIGWKSLKNLNSPILLYELNTDNKITAD